MTSEPDNLWPHFASLVPAAPDGRPTMVRGEGTHLFDDRGRRYIDLLSSLYCVNAGHGRDEIGDAMARQAKQLAFYPNWGTVTPPTRELAQRVAAVAPAGFSKVFFTCGGSESVDAAWKLTRQYHRHRGKPAKTKIVARQGAYHGTTMGALSVTGVPSLREPFEPLVPGVVHVPGVDPFHTDQPARQHSIERAEAVAAAIEAEGPDTVGAIIVEPVQNSGGCLVAEPEHFTRLREIADTYDVLLISDETICSWGRTGAYFGCQVYDYRPDIITTAKGLTSGYAPMGALIASDKVVEPFNDPNVYFNHGLTFGGHPVAASAGLANLDILEREHLMARAREVGRHFHEELESLTEIPIVGDVRGQAMFQAVELVRDTATHEPLSPAERAALSAFVPDALYENGVICRAMHRGAPILQFAPPLVATEREISTAVDGVRDVLKRSLEVIG